MNNNYLDSIVNELKNFPQSNSEILNLIQSKKNVYNRFKREFIKEINNIKSKNLKAFALLVATNFKDNDFLNTITQNFNFDLINNDLAIFAKGIYFLSKNDNLKAVNLLWQSFNLNKHLYFNHQTFLTLICLFEDFKLSKERHILLQYLISTFPYVIEYHMQYILFLMQVKFNDDFTLTLAESNAIILREIDYIYNHAQTSFDWNFLADFYFKFVGDVDKFWECSKNATLTLNVTDNNIDVKRDTIFPIEIYKEHLDSLLDFLNANNIQAFPCSGSLLGLYRDGKLMDYDKDTDTGIIVNNNDEILNIIKILSANKILICSQINKLNFNKKILNISVSHKKNGSIVDIFFFHKNYYDYDKSHPKYNYLYTGIDTIVASLVEEFKPFKIIKKNLAGHIYNVPENIEEWLLQEYGKDWNKHISVWDSLINDPNITEESKLAVFYFGSIRMHEAFRQKKYAKALNYYTQLKNRWNYPFTAEMCQKIELCLEQIKPVS